MFDRSKILAVVVGIVVLANLPIAAAQQPDPDSPRYKAVIALSDFLTGTGEEALHEFVADRVSHTLIDSFGRDRLVRALNELRSGFSGAEMSGARPESPTGAYIRFSNGESISFAFEADPPHRFVRIGEIGGESTPAPNADATPAQTRGIATFAQLDEKLQAEAAAEAFSGVVLVAKDGKPIFLEAYGYADKNAGVLNKTDTKFNLGSINKIFTMMAVYQLIEAGTLSLDDTIGKYLPKFPPAVADKVTVKHLLEHRSGWAAYWDNPTWNARRAELRSLDDYMDFIKDIPLDFEPGARQQYSNTGYEVLGAIVEKAAGQSYFDYVRENVYEPAGMMATDAYLRNGSTPNMAIGYAGGGYGEDNSSMLSPKGSAAGGGMSTAPDMLRFANAIDEGTLLSSPHANRFRGIGVGGGGPGVNAMLEMDVAGGHTIVVLSNFDPPTASRIIQEISAMLRAIAAAESGGQLYRIGVECASTEPTVVQFGAMRDVMREGYTESRIHLADAVTQPHAFAIGALESLSGEITIIDGDVWVSRAADDGLQVTGPEPIAEDQATLLTLAHVAKWQSVTIERAVEGHELELLIEKTARTRGIDTAEPFAFLIEGELGSLDLHVINGYCPIGTNPATVDAKPWR